MPPSNKQAGAKREKIDVIIPAIEKDLPTLPHVIDSIRKHVKHPIGQIMVVSPLSKKIKALCREKDCRYIHEKRLLPIGKKDIHYRSKRWDLSGWLLQQLLKWSGDKISTQKSYLVIDADTVLIRPHVFKLNGKSVFYCRNWSRNEYFRTYRRLVGKKADSPVSFVTHYMLFEKAKLARLKKIIERRHGKTWHEAILKCINRSRIFAFSEFETYGNFVRSTYPDSYLVRRALNKSLYTNASALSPQRIAKLSQKYRSLSFHKRKGYYKKKK
ncbi:DUF6492 family protein [Brevibacillus migulae]|uniref:DUF6492 family protein n=1 Tax=Brevibacillus migulae TaxID=1644114 RepID=UPI00106EAB0A|nr:DUF6492 family protein [Brevibacillus migulae]